MTLRGIEFENAFVASGALNFFGEGWKHHKVFKTLFPKGFNFSGATFVSKTTTLNCRKGNLELDANLQPIRLFPNCVCANPFKQIVLNAVGLSGPGAEHLFATGLWQERKEPFLISFMAVATTKEGRINEVKEFRNILSRELPSFSTQIGVELNISCPNTTHNPSDLVNDAIEQLQAFVGVGIPVVLKVNVLTPTDAITRIANSGMCDAITVSNTLPWGQLPEKINWKGIFGSSESPLKHLGGGGLSGYPLLPIVVDWISNVRKAGISIPIIGGGGILKPADVRLLYESGANGIMIGSVAILRPWRVASIIKEANKIFGGKQK
jgi:dihydroorotate dehydrogenase